MELIAIAARREGLQHQHAAITEPKPLLHPDMAAIYRAKVTELARALQEPESRSEATEALRGFVDAIVLTPDQGGETLQIDLRGIGRPCLGPPYKRRGRQNLTTSPCKYRWLRGQDLNLRPLGYEPNELPDCSTPRQEHQS